MGFKNTRSKMKVEATIRIIFTFAIVAISGLLSTKENNMEEWERRF